MMLHRHFEEDKAKRGDRMTRLADVTPHSESVEGLKDNGAAGGVYVEGEDDITVSEPTEEAPAKKPGRPKKN